jgi:hypothetical protein
MHLMTAYGFLAQTLDRGTFKGTESRDKYFLKTFKIKSVLSVHVEIDYKFTGCFFKDKKYKVSACFFENTF